MEGVKQGLILMKFLIRPDMTREILKKIELWRTVRESSEIVREVQKELSHEDACVRLAGYGRVLSEMEKKDEISKVKQRFFYYRMWSTVLELVKTDEKLKKLKEKKALAGAKVWWVKRIV